MQAIVSQPQKKAKAFKTGDADKLRFARFHGCQHEEVWLPCLFYSSYEELVDGVMSSEYEKLHKTGMQLRLYCERWHHMKKIPDVKDRSVVRFLGISTKRTANFRMRFLTKEEETTLVKDFFHYHDVMERKYFHRKDFQKALAEAVEVMHCEFPEENEDEESPPQAGNLLYNSPSGDNYLTDLHKDEIKGCRGKSSGSVNDPLSNERVEAFHTPQNPRNNGNSEHLKRETRTKEPLSNPHLENAKMQANSNNTAPHDEINVEFGSSSPDSPGNGEDEEMVDDSSEIAQTSTGDESMVVQQTAEAPRKTTSESAAGISNSISPGQPSTQKITPVKLSTMNGKKQRRNTLHSHVNTAHHIKDVIAADMDFPKVVEILMSQFDWTREKYTGPSDIDGYYISGGFKGKTMQYIRQNCKQGEDYFMGKEKLMEWLHNRYDWVGPQESTFGWSAVKRKANNEDSAATSVNKKRKAELTSAATTKPSKQKKSTATIRKGKTSASKSPRSRSIVAVPRKDIGKMDTFDIAWDILKFSHGWILIGSRLFGYIYVHGRCVKEFGETIDEKFCMSNLTLNRDYFPSSDDLKDYLQREHGWEGLGSATSGTPKRRTPNYRGAKDSNFTKRTLQVDMNQSSPSQPNRDKELSKSVDTQKRPPSASSSVKKREPKFVKNPRSKVKKDDDLGTAKDILRYSGWRYVGNVFVHKEYAKNEEITLSYCRQNLEAEKDYFTCDGTLKAYLHKTIGWVGPKGKEYSPIGERRRRNSSVSIESKPTKQTVNKKKGAGMNSVSLTKIDASNKFSVEKGRTTKKASKGTVKDAGSINSNQSSKKLGRPAKSSKESGKDSKSIESNTSTPKKKNISTQEISEKEKAAIKSTTVTTKEVGHLGTTPNEDEKDEKSSKSILQDRLQAKIMPSSSAEKKKKSNKLISPGSSLPSFQKRNKNVSIETETRGQTNVETNSTLPRNSTSTLKERLDECAQCLNISQPRQNLLYEGNSSSSNFADTKGQIDYFLNTCRNPEGNSKKERSSILYICGRPGTGKTTMVQHCLESPIEMDSSEDGTSPALNYSIVNGATVSDKGLMDEVAKLLSRNPSKKAVLEKALSPTPSGKQRGDPVVLVIDEINFCWKSLASSKKKGQESAESALETIFRWASDPTFRLILIGISNSIGDNDAKAFHKLANVKDEIIFEPYTEKDLTQIIKKRIGSNCELVDDRAITFVSRRVAQGTGDCRLVLNLMSGAIIKCKESLHASKLEEVNVSDPVVKLQHVMKAIKDSGELPLVKIIAALPQDAKMILCIHTALGQVSPTWSVITVRTLRKYCTIATNGHFLGEFSQQSFIDILKFLEDQGLLKFENDEVSNRFGYEDSGDMRIRVGVQIQDVECAIGKTLLEKGTFYQNIVNDARRLSKNL